MTSAFDTTPRSGGGNAQDTADSSQLIRPRQLRTQNTTPDGYPSFALKPLDINSNDYHAQQQQQRLSMLSEDRMGLFRSTGDRQPRKNQQEITPSTNSFASTQDGITPSKFIHSSSYLKRRLEVIDKSKHKGYLENNTVNRGEESSRKLKRKPTNKLRQYTLRDEDYLLDGDDEEEENLYHKSIYNFDTPSRGGGGGGSQYKTSLLGQSNCMHLDRTTHIIATDGGNRRRADSTMNRRLANRKSICFGEHCVCECDDEEMQSNTTTEMLSYCNCGGRCEHAKHVHSHKPYHLERNRNVFDGRRGGGGGGGGSRGLVQSRYLPHMVDSSIIVDPQTSVHLQYQRANQQREKDQKKVVSLLSQQDKIMDRLVDKYKKRAVSEEQQIHKKLNELEKERDRLLQTKEQEKKLGVMQKHLAVRLGSFKNDVKFYNDKLAPSMPQIALPPNLASPYELGFLTSLLSKKNTTAATVMTAVNSSANKNLRFLQHNDQVQQRNKRRNSDNRRTSFDVQF